MIKKSPTTVPTLNQDKMAATKNHLFTVSTSQKKDNEKKNKKDQ